MTNGNEPINYQLDWGNQGIKVEGLTKREYFTAMAMQGLCARNQGWDNMKALAEKAVEIADDTLTQLNKPTTNGK